MINMSKVLANPRMRQPFTVYRKSGYWDAADYGRWKQTETPLNHFGVITVTDAETIEQLPEGDRTTGLMTFYDTQELFKTHNNEDEKGTSDEIVWRKERYRILKIWPYIDYGYFKAVGVKKPISR